MNLTQYRVRKKSFFIRAQLNIYLPIKSAAHACYYYLQKVPSWNTHSLSIIVFNSTNDRNEMNRLESKKERMK